MFLKFPKEFDVIFRRKGALWLKMLTGAAVCGIVTAVTLFEQRAQNLHLDSNTEAIVIVVAMAVGALVGLMLSLKDYVRLRLMNYQPVNIVLRAYFCWGGLSVMIWIVTAFIATIAALWLSCVIRGIRFF
jgi:hypothetical protein